MSSSSYTPEKLLWTENDFEQMGWHDVYIHGFALDPARFDFLFDIDYIFKWVNPREGETSYKFWLAPATLVFHEARCIRVQLDFDTEVSLQDIRRSDPSPMSSDPDFAHKVDFSWVLDANEGEISFRASGFSQHIRRQPTLHGSQAFTLEERQGISFERIETKSAEPGAPATSRGGRR